jgi:hypothetical protein
MNSEQTQPFTFDSLNEFDLDWIYEKGKEAMLRDLAFSILLAHTDTVDKLENLAFNAQRGLAGWSTKELIEITNHFRLLSSPANEIRLYRECQDKAFLSAPRVREFYVLALNKIGLPMEAIQEASKIIAAGENSGLIWAALGESYSARAFFAEKLIQSLMDTPSNKRGISTPIRNLDPFLLNQFPDYFPEVKSPIGLTIAQVREMRKENLQMATRIFSHGFRDSGTSFSGLGWMQRTIDSLTDLVLEHSHLKQKEADGNLDEEEELRLQFIDNDIRKTEQALDDQAVLVGIALKLQGGMESLDYWTRAGTILLEVMRGATRSKIQTLMPHLFAATDANFKLATTLAELIRVRDNYVNMIEHVHGRDTSLLALRVSAAEYAIGLCNEAGIRFRAKGRGENSETRKLYRTTIKARAVSPLQAFLDKTMNFRTLTASLVPLNISGGLGRVGSRVPDLHINRQVQEDLIDLVETRILQILTPEDRKNPLTVIARIQQMVGTGLKVEDLQDLQSPTHAAFDIRSDGLIALSGIDHDMRKNARTGTDLTAALLMQNGDCRETMYLNGTLFACWQQIQVKQRITRAMLCLELDYREGFQTIINEDIPRLMRYQLRGGQVMVYVESIGMKEKYHCERIDKDDATALFRSYGVDELCRNEPLTHYELENGKLKVTYVDGSILWIEPKDSATGRSRPMDHRPVPGGGVPLIPNAGVDYENLQSLQLTNLVEEHALTFLYDSSEQTITLCDGFYNKRLYNSPYSFNSGVINVEDIDNNNGLIGAGNRLLKYMDGSCQEHPVYLKFLPFSQTDYEAALVEGDIPETIQLMGKVFSGDLKRERKRLEEGASPIPALLERVQAWERARREAPTLDKMKTERRLARLILDLARNHPELVQLQEFHARQPVIVEDVENNHVFLILSGQFGVSRFGNPICDDKGAPVVLTAGGILGELSALRGGGASATVAGNGVVFGIEMSVIQQQLADNQEFRECVEEMTHFRIQ